MDQGCVSVRSWRGVVLAAAVFLAAGSDARAADGRVLAEAMRDARAVSAGLREARAASAAAAEELIGGGWTDEAILKAYHEGRLSGDSLRAAILDPVLPEEERPKAFFDALAWYFDGLAGERDRRLSGAELSGVLRGIAGWYVEALESGEAADRVQAWKLIQKGTLLSVKLREWKRADYPYPDLKDISQDEKTKAWSQAHTIKDTADFKAKACDLSRQTTVLVKFGNKACSDCLLLELLGSLKAVADRNPNIAVYKSWWGPNEPREMDELRRQEGAKSSPFFILYRGGRRYRCGYGFPDEKGDGLEACLAKDLTGPGDGECLDWK